MSALASAQILIVWLATLPATLIWGDRIVRNASLVVGGMLAAVWAVKAFVAGSDGQIILTLVDAIALGWFLRLSLQVDRRFPLFLAAAALIGLLAGLLRKFSVASQQLELLALDRGDGLVMLLALWIATVTSGLRNGISNGLSIAPTESLR